MPAVLRGILKYSPQRRREVSEVVVPRLVAEAARHITFRKAPSASATGPNQCARECARMPRAASAYRKWIVSTTSEIESPH
jgi:hypothetical protein